MLMLSCSLNLSFCDADSSLIPSEPGRSNRGSSLCPLVQEGLVIPCLILEACSSHGLCSNPSVLNVSSQTGHSILETEHPAVTGVANVFFSSTRNTLLPSICLATEALLPLEVPGSLLLALSTRWGSRW